MQRIPTPPRARPLARHFVAMAEPFREWNADASPGEHWKHLRTTNPIESTFATVRLRTIKTKGCLSRTTAFTMVFKLCQSAAKKWRGLDGTHRLAEIVEGVKFKDGEKLIERAA